MRKQLFDEAIGEAPPSTVDVDAAIARGRRAARFRGLGSPVVAVAAGAVLVIGGVAVAVLPQRTSTAPGEDRIEDQSAACDEAAETPLPLLLAEPTEDTARRLTGVVKPLFEQRLTEGRRLVNYTPDLSGNRPGPLVFDKLEVPTGFRYTGDCRPRPEYFGGHAYVFDTADKMIGGIMVQVSRLGGGNVVPTKCPTDPAVSYCSVHNNEMGAWWVVTTRTSGDHVTNSVEMTKPDGTWVGINVDNDIYTSDGQSPDAMEPSLTLDQLVEIALDPALTLYV